MTTTAKPWYSSSTMSGPQLYRIPLDGEGKPAPGKISEMLLEFAEPLMHLDPDGPPDIKGLGNIMMLAELCWNLPVFEWTKSPNYQSYQQHCELVLQAVPGPVADTLRRLMEDRKGRFGEIPFLITSRVEGGSLNNAAVVAEARMPERSERRSMTNDNDNVPIEYEWGRDGPAVQHRPDRRTLTTGSVL